MNLFNHLREKLENVRMMGDGFTARCPAHEDHRNSLKVDRRGRRTLVYCHAGCSFDEVIEASSYEGSRRG